MNSRELIEEARDYVRRRGGTYPGALVDCLADALEEAEAMRAARVESERFAFGQASEFYQRMRRLKAAIREALEFIGDGCTPGCCAECEAKNEIFDYLRPILDDALKGED